jgi:hypothetical protein
MKPNPKWHLPLPRLTRAGRSLVLLGGTAILMGLVVGRGLAAVIWG